MLEQQLVPTIEGPSQGFNALEYPIVFDGDLARTCHSFQAPARAALAKAEMASHRSLLRLVLRYRRLTPNPSDTALHFLGYREIA
jgi:hypothetical protein